MGKTMLAMDGEGRSKRIQPSHGTLLIFINTIRDQLRNPNENSFSVSFLIHKMSLSSFGYHCLSVQ
jgi:hypothetical protein